MREIAAVLPAQSAQAEKEKLSNRIQEYYGLEEQYVEIEIAGGEGPVDLSPDSGRDSLYSGFPAGSKSSRMALSVSRSADEAVTASGPGGRVLRLMERKWRSGCGKFCGAFPVWERWM